MQHKNHHTRPVIGIAWRTLRHSVSFRFFCEAVEEAGADYIMLDQVFSPHLSYDSHGKLTEGVGETGALTEAVGKMLQDPARQDSNAREVLKNVDAVLFTGGQDVSPSLYKHQKPWHKIMKERDYLAERDVSDYLLMHYCLDRDIPLLGACRGMQMLAVISGAEMIQDIPSYFRELGAEYHYQHRPFYTDLKEDAPKDFAHNDVQVVEDTLLYSIMERDLLKGCPCWHHQAVKNVEGTPLKVSGYTMTGQVPMIEVVERNDQTFALGVQFHPEASVLKKCRHSRNRKLYLDCDSSLLLFRSLAAAGLKKRETSLTMGVQP